MSLSCQMLADTPPLPVEKAELIKCRFGSSQAQFFECGVSWEFHEEIMSAFPKLSDGGGYELMRTQPNNNQELCVQNMEGIRLNI